jgi:uncharacterized SAM-binding protein YcdF (DUF218 family)
MGFLARDLGLAASASVWLGAALLGVLLCFGRLRPVLVATLLVLAVTWMAVAFTPLTTRLAHGLVRVDVRQPVDAVVVLGSRIQQDGEPTAVAQSRLLHALELVAEGVASHLVVTELVDTPSAHARLLRAEAKRLRLDVDVVSIGPVYRTHDEAVAMAALCEAHGWRRVMMVTSPLHSRRAAACLEREGLQVVSSPATETLFDLEHLDRPTERLPAFAAILHERAGLWLYARRGWITSEGR